MRVRGGLSLLAEVGWARAYNHRCPRLKLIDITQQD